MRSNSPDRRVQRTRARLHEALASLIHEKPFEGVVVKEILARADVGRSTFYGHFRSKEELLDSSILDVLEAGAKGSGKSRSAIVDETVECARQVFEHIERHRSAGEPIDAQRQAVVHERLKALLVRRLADRLEWSPGDQRASARALPDELMALFVASTFVTVLEWWLNGDMGRGPAEVSDILRGLITPAFTQA